MDTLLDLPELQGKDDKDHSRLQQYKLLEQKKEARDSAGDNALFLFQSGIEVEMINEVLPELDRIHEMIHRNNQLNFTKNRISKEELEALLKDETVTAAYVKAKDKYGDHGIIGFYAVKGGKAVQFVFSCRILGMGVEQYVYAQLGFPKIEVIGETASTLDGASIPEWINQKKQSAPQTENQIAPIKVIAYGACMLQPIAGYIENKIQELYKIFTPTYPSICNIARILKYTPEEINNLVKTVPTLQSNTFAKEIFSGNYDYIIASAREEFNCYKYTSCQNNELYAYAKSKQEITDFTVSPITSEEIEEHIQYIRDNLPEQTKLVILNAPDIIIPDYGKDADYHNRLRINEIINKIAAINKNVSILDMRKYIRSISDINGTELNHYKRFVGFSLTVDFLNLAGTYSAVKSNRTPQKWTDKWSIEGKVDDDVNAEMYLWDMTIHISLYLKNSELYEYRYNYICGAFTVIATEFSDQTKIEFNIGNFGFWYARVEIRRKDNSEKNYSFNTHGLNIDEYNFTSYIGDSLTDAMHEKLISMLENRRSDMYIENRIKDKITSLLAYKVNIFERFKDKKTVIILENEIAPAIVRAVTASGVKVKYYTTGWYCDVVLDFGFIAENIPPLPEDFSCISENDTVVLGITVADEEFWRIKSRLLKRKATLVSLEKHLDELSTKYIFAEKVQRILPKSRLPLIICDLGRSDSYPLYMTENERASAGLNPSLVLKIKKENPDSLPLYYNRYTVDQLSELMTLPLNEKKPAEIWKLNDRAGNYVNIENGFRKTTGQPPKAKGTIYIFGPDAVFGVGLPDEDAIASRLQKLTGTAYRVMNCSNSIGNVWNPNTYNNAFRLMQSMPFIENDIIIIIWIYTWFERVNFNAFEPSVLADKFKLIDAVHLFAEKNRDDYRLMPFLLTEKGTQKAAELLFKAIQDAGGSFGAFQLTVFWFLRKARGFFRHLKKNGFNNTMKLFLRKVKNKVKKKL